MSALGHKRTCAAQNVMSALHPKATLNAFLRNNLNIGKLDEMAETPLPGNRVYTGHMATERVARARHGLCGSFL